MASKQHSISLPEEASAILDGLPRGEKSQMVAEALLLLKKEKARLDAISILDSITPTDWGTDTDSVQLVQGARNQRAKNLTGNNNG